MIPHTKIDDALVRLREDQEGKPYLEFQPRNEAGQLRFLVWYRDRHYEGPTYDAVWLSSENADEIAALGLKSIGNEPDYDKSPIGWTVEQETKAKCWAGDIIATNRIASRFSFQPQQMRAAE